MIGRPKRYYQQFYVLLALLHLATLSPGHSFFGSQPFIQNYKNQDFQTVENQIWANTSDDQGRMIFGHNNAILIFNASEWKRIPLPNKSYVRSLCKGDDGKIYVGGVSELGYLEFDNRLGYQYFSLKDLLEDSTFKSDEPLEL